MLLDRICFCAQRTPDSKAVIAWDGEVSYRELWHRSEQIALWLNRHGIGSGHLVAIYLDRSTRVVIAMVGIMRSGAAYTVVERDGVQAENLARLHSIAADMVVAEESLTPSLLSDGLTVVPWPAMFVVGPSASPDTLQGGDTNPLDPAYVLYTSGSTGVSKGVAISHGNIAHYTASLLERLVITAPLRYAHVSTMAADLGNTCLFLSLWSGGELHLLDGVTRRDASRMSAYLSQRRIDVLKTTPSHWEALFGRPDALPFRLAFLILGGELLRRDLAARLWDSGATDVLCNHYGPTETTVGVAVHVIRTKRDLLGVTGTSVPIGSPIGQTRLLVRVEDGAFHATDATGELYIGGPSVGIGYAGEASATAAAFLSGIEGAGRFYRTGDLASIAADGTVTFLGRFDNQVKVNGFRVELEQVEAALSRFTAVRNAAVFLVPVGGHDQLAAAVCGRFSELDTADLQQRLSDILPSHMVPTRWVRLAALPRNENGKVDRKALKKVVLDGIVETAQFQDSGKADEDRVVSDIHHVWCRVLDRPWIGDRDDFFEIGGDSLSAIQAISELQSLGHDVPAPLFLRNPSPVRLAEAIRQRSSSPSDSVWPMRESGCVFSSAQNDFFGAEFADPGLWNQAVLLESARSIEPGLLKEALVRLVACHPLLATAFRRRDGVEGTWEAKAYPVDLERILSTSELPPFLESPRAAIEGCADSVQRSVNIEVGLPFRMHLFKGRGGIDYLLMCCHHLSIDVVSWRILVDDLDRVYADLSSGTAPTLAAGRHTFWDWVDHLDASRALLAGDLAFFAGASSGGVPSAAAPLDNVEGASRSVWLGFERDETEALAISIPGVRLHSSLLAAFTQSYLAWIEQDAVEIDVESHGRMSFDERLDPSRLVGWFTSTFPLRIPRRVEADAAMYVETVLAEVPHLGIAHGLMQSETKPRSTVGICYNYIGDMRFPRGTLGLKTVSFDLGTTRGPANDRRYALKLSGRILDGQLIVDLSYGAKWTDDADMIRLLEDTRRTMRRWAATPPMGCCFHDFPILTEAGSKTGALTYVPQAYTSSRPSFTDHGYRKILLTGSTGFVGCHILHELLTHTGATVVCIVRAADDVAAGERLQEVYDHYFSGESSSARRRRCIALAGDVTDVALGLSAGLYDELMTEIDAIYHFAADTRLLGPPSVFDRHNVRAVEAVIHCAESGRPKHLHYMSTLAVAGVNETESLIPFREDSFDIGQVFQNSYEATKFAAEKLVRAFVTRGGTACIYRSGNISGHSQTGRFQRNARDNRFVQLLRGLAEGGAVPSRVEGGVVLSPVDIVAKGIVSLSLDAASAGRVFHVENERETSYEDVFAAMRRIGIRLDMSDASDLARSLQQGLPSPSPNASLALFWAQRPPRNVHYDTSRTRAELLRKGIAFPPLGPDWLARFLRGLITHVPSSSP